MSDPTPTPAPEALEPGGMVPTDYGMVPGCPNTPPCLHARIAHDVEDADDPLPMCCVDGCDCGHDRSRVPESNPTPDTAAQEHDGSPTALPDADPSGYPTDSVPLDPPRQRRVDEVSADVEKRLSTLGLAGSGTAAPDQEHVGWIRDYIDELDAALARCRERNESECSVCVERGQIAGDIRRLLPSAGLGTAAPDEVDQLREQLREEQIWREDMMREVSGLDPDRPLAKTARRYRQERDTLRQRVAELETALAGSGTAAPDLRAALVADLPKPAMYADEHTDVKTWELDELDFAVTVHPAEDEAGVELRFAYWTVSPSAAERFAGALLAAAREARRLVAEGER